MRASLSLRVAVMILLAGCHQHLSNFAPQSPPSQAVVAQHVVAQPAGSATPWPTAPSAPSAASAPAPSSERFFGSGRGGSRSGVRELGSAAMSALVVAGVVVGLAALIGTIFTAGFESIFGAR